MRSAVRRVQRGRWCRDCGSCRGKEWRGLESRTRYWWRGIGSVRRLRRCCFASREVETSILRVSWVGARRQQWALGIGKALASEGGPYKRETQKGKQEETLTEWLQYAVAWTFVKTLGVLPRPVARGVASAGASLLLLLLPKLRKTAEFNLRLAFPEWTDARRRDVMRKMTRNLGWMAAEFARFPKYTAENIEQTVVLDGHENFLAGKNRGKGVLFLTGHIGAWELSSFAHGLYGYPLRYMARPLDNKPLDAMVNRYRGLSGNQPIFKNESARA